MKCSVCFTEIPDHIADLWLESIARGTMHVLSEEILKIHDLSAHGKKQLITDIGKYQLFKEEGFIFLEIGKKVSLFVSDTQAGIRLHW